MVATPVPIKFNPQGPVNFSPYGTIALGVTGGGTASISAAFTTDLSINANSLMVYNGTTAVVFVTSGYSGDAPIAAAAATSTESNNSTPIGPGAIVLLTKRGVTIPNYNVGVSNAGKAYDTVAVYPGSNTGTVYFTAGDGV